MIGRAIYYVCQADRLHLGWVFRNCARTLISPWKGAWYKTGGLHICLSVLNLKCQAEVVSVDSLWFLIGLLVITNYYLSCNECNPNVWNNVKILKICEQFNTCLECNIINKIHLISHQHTFKMRYNGNSINFTSHLCFQTFSQTLESDRSCLRHKLRAFLGFEAFPEAAACSHSLSCCEVRKQLWNVSKKTKMKPYDWGSDLFNSI